MATLPGTRMAAMAERFVIPDDLAPAAAREGRDDWLAELPALVARIAADWQIEIGDPFLPGGATAWVAPVRDEAGSRGAAAMLCSFIPISTPVMSSPPSASRGSPSTLSPTSETPPTT